MILFKGGISEHTIFCLFRSGMENMKCRVTEVTVGGEAELLLDLYGGGTFYKEWHCVLLSAVFSCLLYWDQHQSWIWKCYHCSFSPVLLLLLLKCLSSIVQANSCLVALAVCTYSRVCKSDTAFFMPSWLRWNLNAVVSARADRDGFGMLCVMLQYCKIKISVVLKKKQNCMWVCFCLFINYLDTRKYLQSEIQCWNSRIIDFEQIERVLFWWTSEQRYLELSCLGWEGFELFGVRSSKTVSVTWC